MRAFRAYCFVNSIEVGGNYQLSPQTSYHLSRVLRASVEDLIEVFDGNGHRYEARIESLQEQVIVKILKEKQGNKEPPIPIILMISVGKGDKMDWVIQKATELGVTEIIPLTSTYGEVHLSEERWRKKIGRWREISIHACEQCDRDTLPKISEVLSFGIACQKEKIGLKLLLHPDKNAIPLKTILETAAAKIVLLVGPEGGFDEQEVRFAIHQGFRLASLGPRILRMETAAITCLAITQALQGDL